MSFTPDELWNEHAAEIWGDVDNWVEALADPSYTWGADQIGGDALLPDSDYSEAYVDWIESGGERYGAEYFDWLVEAGVIEDTEDNRERYGAN